MYIQDEILTLNMNVINTKNKYLRNSYFQLGALFIGNFICQPTDGHKPLLPYRKIKYYSFIKFDMKYEYLIEE